MRRIAADAQALAARIQLGLVAAAEIARRLASEKPLELGKRRRPSGRGAPEHAVSPVLQLFLVRKCETSFAMSRRYSAADSNTIDT